MISLNYYYSRLENVKVNEVFSIPLKDHSYKVLEHLENGIVKCENTTNGNIEEFRDRLNVFVWR